jgi:hypothetical protein
MENLLKNILQLSNYREKRVFSQLTNSMFTESFHMMFLVPSSKNTTMYVGV